MVWDSVMFVFQLLIDKQNIMAAKNIAVASHPPYSPEFSHCGVLFPRMKLQL
jgi:hypothetical protein